MGADEARADSSPSTSPEPLLEDPVGVRPHRPSLRQPLPATFCSTLTPPACPPAFAPRRGRRSRSGSATNGKRNARSAGFGLPLVREVEPRLVGARGERLVAEREPGDERDAVRPHPVERLGDPARLERDRHARRVGRVRVPAELGHPERGGCVRQVAARPRRRARLHLRQVAERDVVRRVPPGGSGRRTCTGASTRRRSRRASLQVGCAPCRDAEQRAHERERAPVVVLADDLACCRGTARGRRRRRGCRGHAVDRVGERVHHPAVPSRRRTAFPLTNCGDEEEAEVRLVPGLPETHARQAGVPRPL